jgi:uncharacterized protein YceK
MKTKSILIILATIALLSGCAKDSPTTASTPVAQKTAAATPVAATTPTATSTPEAGEVEPSGPLVEMLPGKKWTVVDENGTRSVAVDFVIESDFTADLGNNMTAVFIPNGDKLIENVKYAPPQKYYMNITYQVEVISPTEFKAVDIALDNNMGMSANNTTVFFKVVE